jgi:hypothetical protein
MDLWRTLSVLVRRWYLVVPTFLLAIGIAAAIYASTPKRFVSTSVLLLTTPPTGASTPREPGTTNPITNPLLNFGPGLNTSATILIQALSTPETAAALGVSAGSDTQYKVNSGSDNAELLTSGPFVFIEGESSSEAEAKSVVARLVERAHQELENRQRGLEAPVDTFITMTEVMPPTTPKAEGGSRVRAAAAAGALGVMASLAMAYGVESYSESRRRRQPA